MDGDEIAVVLSRASQLRSKINSCIEKATQRKNPDDGDSHLLGEADDEDEAESLLNIRDALESLEEQLCSLQVSRCFLSRWVFLFIFFFLFLGQISLFLGYLYHMLGFVLFPFYRIRVWGKTLSFVFLGEMIAFKLDRRGYGC